MPPITHALEHHKHKDVLKNVNKKSNYTRGLFLPTFLEHVETPTPYANLGLLTSSFLEYITDETRIIITTK